MRTPCTKLSIIAGALALGACDPGTTTGSSNRGVHDGDADASEDTGTSGGDEKDTDQDDKDDDKDDKDDNGGAADDGGDDKGGDDNGGDDNGDDDGGDDKGDDGAGGPDVCDAQHFVATLTELNDSGVSGTAFFTIENGEFSVSIEAEGMFASVVHPQHVHAGPRCPTMAADVNEDGFLDVIEGLPDYGAIVIPLDNDLRTQIPGEFPTADEEGNLFYRATVAFQTMLDDLHAEDPDLEDATIKLEEGEPLNLETRHVVLHGIDPDAGLPESVATLHGLSREITLPVACGQILVQVPEED